MDWYQHYLQKAVLLEDPSLEVPFVRFVRRHLETRARILECGCGPGLSAAALARAGFCVLGVDSDRRLLALATDVHQDLVHAGRLAFAHLDIRDLPVFFRPHAFDACTHSGVLEHYCQAERRLLLERQLQVAPRIFLSVPLPTPVTGAYFSRGPSIPDRQMQQEELWLSEFSSGFACRATERALQRSENAFFFLEADPQA